ncbi:MAG: gliding motility-associated C-terminal domain-containing protein [Lewinellaceae bacterium]|nr:gliding motility-associated C-terminal domain-containing protein [Saprospiraceae bacterium]MCB9340147.1 gliding motility-associated C-terminal domain-containing protein [Lewinellaceae bacterium]
MRNILHYAFLFLTACIPSFLFSQQKECIKIDWSRHYGGTNQEIANDIQQTQDGGYIVAGFTRSVDFDVASNFGSADYWILKLDTAGQIEWEKTFGGTDFDIATSVVQTPDGGFAAAGGALSSNGQVNGSHGAEDVWVIKLDPSGNLQWQRAIGGFQNERAERIRNTSDGGFIVAGYSQSKDGDLTNNNGDFDYLMVKLNGSGNIEWQRSFGGSLADFGYDVRETSDGGFVMAGSTFSNNGDVGSNKGLYDYWLVKVDAGGSLLWEKSFGGSGEERAYSMITTADNGIAVAGSSTSSDDDLPGNNGSYDVWLMKTDAGGNLLWSKNFGGSSEDRAFSLGLTANQEFLLAGLSVSSNGDVSTNYGSKDAWLLKLDPDGNLLWEKNFGGTSEDRFYAILQTLDGGYVGAGLSASGDKDLDGNNGLQDLWVLRMGPDSLKFDLGADTSLCAGETLLLKVAQDSALYQWQDGSSNMDFTVSSPGTYWVEVNQEGCKTRDTINVNYIGDIPVQLGNDTVLCQGETLVLDTGIDGASYNWKNGTSAPTLPVQFPGTYWVEVTKDGCQFFDTIEVGFITVQLDLGKDTFLCQGQLLPLNVAQPDAAYRWQDGSTNPTYNIAESGLYWVEAGLGGCVKTDSIIVTFQTRPDTILADFAYICEDEGIWLDASQPAASYTWQDGSTNPKYKAVVPGKYSVEVTIHGCPFSDEVELRPCEECLYVPNVFSPNGDGINDLFQGFPGCEILNYRLLVFDRWGSLLFESFQPSSGWDGNFKGKKMDIGAYAFLIGFDYINNNKVKHQQRKGIVNLLR